MRMSAGVCNTAAEAHRARPNGEREGKPVERCCTPVMRACALSLAGLLCLGACAHSLTAEQEAVLRRGDCAELLRAADGARAQDRGGVASSLANACSQQGLSELVAKAADPAHSLLWCGRAKAAHATASCDPATVASLASQLHRASASGLPNPASPPIPTWSPRSRSWVPATTWCGMRTNRT